MCVCKYDDDIVYYEYTIHNINSQFPHSSFNLGVDDAEDADVILHELGHGIHDFLTVGHLSQIEGLSEGIGDYIAMSYSRSKGLLKKEPIKSKEYDWVFKWVSSSCERNNFH